MAGKIKWTIEDNVVALYIARYGNDGLKFSKSEIRDLIEHTGIPKRAFPMRVGNFRYIITGKGEFDAGYKNGFPKYKKLYILFKSFGKKKFREYVNLILETRVKFKE